MFEGVLITDTFVLGWYREADRLVFDVEASLWPGHPAYEPPRPGEWACYKLARIVFDGVRVVEGLSDMERVKSHIDPDGSRDYGSFDELVAEPGGYHVAGEFGVVRILAGSARLEVGAHR